jgi:hypothetical protein
MDCSISTINGCKTTSSHVFSVAHTDQWPRKREEWLIHSLVEQLGNITSKFKVLDLILAYRDLGRSNIRVRVA